MSSNDLAWLSGWLEGEGCFHIGRQINGQHRFVVEGVSADLDVIERAHQIAGVGYVRAKKKSGSKGHIRSNRTIYSWRVEKRADVIPLLKSLYPFMGERRREAIDAMLAANEAWKPPTHEERSERAKKMWVTRRNRYGEKGRSVDIGV